MQRLLCKVKHYDWGSHDENSIVAKFAKEHDDFEGPFAEFWMGNHPNGQSYNVDSNKPFDKKLSFLFKYLSIAKPLSIQVHPDKKTAEELHSLNPELYKDDNHKPEMAIALKESYLLYGFKEDWKEVLAKYPELEKKETLPELIEYLLSLKHFEIDVKDEKLQDLMMHYPNDNGVLIALFMNYVKLNPDDAIVINPNVPHAYLYGELVECMACSDNVIRAGLTSKPIDVENLLKYISYDTTLPKLVKSKDGYYSSGFKEFDVIKIEVLPDQTDVFYCKTPSILSVYQGNGVIEINDNTHIIEPYGVYYVFEKSIVSVNNSGQNALIFWIACSPNL